MSHAAQLEFVGVAKHLFPEMFSSKKVLEVGSLDINGSIRGLFENCDYIGLDVGPGPGVDVVCEGQKYKDPDASFETIICCEVMEHNPFWGDTFRNMIRLLKPNGLLIMSCATTGRPEHGTKRSDPGASPLTIEWEYYRNLTARDVTDEVDFSGFTYAFVVEKDWHDLYLLAFKGKDPRISEFKAIYRQRALKAWKHRALVAVQNPMRITAFLKRRKILPFR